MMPEDQTKGFRMQAHARYLTVSSYVTAEHNSSFVGASVSLHL